MTAPLSRLRRERSLPLRDERGATMVEYGLMVALVALVVAIGAAALGQGIAGAFDEVGRCAKFADKAVAAPAQEKVGGWKCQP